MALFLPRSSLVQWELRALDAKLKKRASVLSTDRPIRQRFRTFKRALRKPVSSRQSSFERHHGGQWVHAVDRIASCVRRRKFAARCSGDVAEKVEGRRAPSEKGSAAGERSMRMVGMLGRDVSGAR